ncbi:PH domain-containing protein [Metabacillus fastidiosus]|uniref:PH domain-containing protein n=1 Tax=Metabacillus fastidiosus TaxID=1458 RepID=UPI000824C49D|nr:PH domain-containing protein [Metabacillus fastidiosus]MED4461812.1 PH domain-containing protein [Metabacillus fastidiosus]
MGIYRTICYKVEDVFIKFLTKKQEPEVVKRKVSDFRSKQEEEIKKKKEEQEKRKQEQIEQERREMEELLSNLMDDTSKPFTQYEINEIKKNKSFFQALGQKVLENGEKILTFIYCEYDKSSKQEIKGYLIATNKRVLFLTKNLNYMDKFRYQTIINVNWFKDGLLERGLKIQYGKRRLEFDEIFDIEQMKRIGNILLSKASKV